MQICDAEIQSSIEKKDILEGQNALPELKPNKKCCCVLFIHNLK